MVLHGLGRTQASMSGMRRFLEAHGYPIWSRTYPSRSMPVAELAEMVAGWITTDLGPDAQPLAVTHSLGGILVRLMSPRIAFSRIVMLAPPNGGSLLANDFSHMALFRHVFGPAGTDVASPHDWPVPECPTAVIAGNLAPSIGNPISWVSAGMRTFGPDIANDGTVAVDETHLPNMERFFELPVSHTWIMNNGVARKETLAFLQASDQNNKENNGKARKPVDITAAPPTLPPGQKGPHGSA